MLKPSGEITIYTDGACQSNQLFEVPAKAGFDIEIKSGICEYICTFLP